MGNWRTVNIIGTCPEDQVESLREKITVNWDEWTPVGPLSSSDQPSMCGVNIWPDKVINVNGNLFERDYGVECVADHLKQLVEVAPGLSVKVHCGDEWESDNCVATIVVENGNVEIGAPEVATVESPSHEQMKENLREALRMQC